VPGLAVHRHDLELGFLHCRGDYRPPSEHVNLAAAIESSRLESRGCEPLGIRPLLGRQELNYAIRFEGEVMK
jgi:hypothetical protein